MCEIKKPPKNSDKNEEEYVEKYLNNITIENEEHKIGRKKIKELLSRKMERIWRMNGKRQQK